MEAKLFNTLSNKGKAQYWAQASAEGTHIPILDFIGEDNITPDMPKFKFMCVEKRKATKHLEVCEITLYQMLHNGHVENDKMLSEYIKFRYNS